MAMSARAIEIAAQLTEGNPKLGDIKKLGKTINIDHDLALELWSTGNEYLRLLATLIFDKKRLTQATIDALATDMLSHDEDVCNQLSDWLLANQLTKNKPLITLVESWQDHTLPILQRWFWYYQARLRWTGKTPPEGSNERLLEVLERQLNDADPKVQWAMNFCAGQIGVFDPELRARCIKLGESSGLYKDQKVAKNCTPNYLPEFIRIEVAKRA